MIALQKSVARSTSIKRFCKDDRGLSTVEYVIILVLIAVSAIGIWGSFGKTIIKKVTDSNNTIDSNLQVGKDPGAPLRRHFVTTPLIALSYSVAAIASTIAAWTDHRTGRIPNWLTLPTVALSLAIRGRWVGVARLRWVSLGS